MDGKNARKSRAQGQADGKDARVERPPYQPPRIVKKRSVSRVTLQFTGGSGEPGGMVGPGPG